MANLDITIKRKVGASYDVLYPTTVIGQVVGLQTALDAKINTTARGAANGVAPLDSSSKVPVANLPAFITGAGRGFYLVGTIGGTASLSAATTGLVAQLVALSGGDYENMYGYFWVCASTTTLSWTDQTTLGPVYRYHVLTPGDEADSTSPVTLEAGDIVVFTKYSDTAGDLDDEEFTFSIINNTYNAASDTVPGIATLSDGNGGILTGLTGSTVITEGNLLGLTYTAGTDLNGITADKLARANHTHSQYLGISSTAAAASKWATARTLTLNGDASGSVSIDGSTDVTLTVAVADDSHAHAFANITSKPTTLSGYGITDAVVANAAITGATNTKITYDAKGLVTAGTTLAATDIPALDTAKITTGTFAIGRIPTGTTSTTVSLGDHTHTFASLTSKPTTLAGYGITDAASSTSLNNRPEIYYNAAADSDGDLVLDLDATTPDF
jgi:hypothetical protein